MSERLPRPHPQSRLTVLGPAPREEWPRNDRGYPLRSWRCRCACGVILPHAVPTASLTRGNTRSCGCLQREAASRAGKRAAVHRHTRSRACAWCGAPFMGTARQRFCSRACNEASRKGRRPAPALCPTCGTPIIQPPVGRTRRHCSDSCRHRHAHRQYQLMLDGTLAEQVAAVEAALQNRIKEG